MSGKTEIILKPGARDLWKGVGATMKRNESPYKLFAIDLIAPKEMLVEKLKSIAYYYGFMEEEQINEQIIPF